MADFFAMGGHAAWIWPSWGITTLVMAGLLLQSRLSARKMAAEAERLKLLRRAGRKRRKDLDDVMEAKQLQESLHESQT